MQIMFESERTYWQDRFDSEDRVAAFPYTSGWDNAPEGIQHVSNTFAPEISGRIATITGGGAPLPVFMVLMAGVKALLYAYTNEEQLIVGTPPVQVPGDSAAPVNPLLLIKTRISPDTAFRSLLNSLRSSVSEAIEHQNLPYWNYTGQMQIPLLASGIPLIATWVTLNQLHTRNHAEKVVAELAFQFDWQDGAASVQVSYEGSKYEERFIRQLLAHLHKLFSVVLFEPELPLLQADFVSKEEKEQLLERFNPAAAPYPQEFTIHQLFEEQARRLPDQTAVVCGGESLTYLELAGRSGAISAALKKAGIQREELVGIIAGRSIDMIAGILGILKAGGAYVPIDPDYPDERIRYLLEDSGVRVLLSSEASRERAEVFSDVIEQILDINEASVKAQLADVEARHAGSAATHDPQQLAYIMYTSGSTGRPKGVMVEHRNVVRLVKQTNYVELDENTRILQTGAVVFDASTFEVWGALLNGGTLYLVEKDVILSAAKLKEAVQAYGITTLWLTSPLFSQLAQQDIGLFSGLHTLIVGGDVLTVPHVNRVLREHPSLHFINGYGPTENTTFSTTHRIVGEQTDAVPIGRPIAHSTAYVVNAANKLAPIGAWGELLVGGDGVARGYLNQPELTAGKFIPNPFAGGGRCYRTGDLARWRPDGALEYKGRIDEQVKIRGFRMELSEIEAELLKIGSVHEAVVVVREEEGGGKYLCAYYSAEEAIPASRIRNELLQELPEYMIPAHFVQLEHLPLNPNGKVDRRALPEPDASLIGGEDYEAPHTPMETKLVEIYQDVLGLERVSVKDNFFDIGGHSLKVLQLTEKIYDELQVDIPIRVVYDYPSVEALAAELLQLEFTKYEYYRGGNIIKLNSSGFLNVFCFPPVLGYGMMFSDMARYLDKHCTVYTLDFIEDYKDHADLYDSYIESILRIQEQGPYVLLGYSAGGNLVFEVAKAMEKKGYEVSDVLIVDSTRRNYAVGLPERLDYETDYLFAYVPEPYNQVLNAPVTKDKVRKKIYAYHHYLSDLVNSGAVQANIHCLVEQNSDIGEEAKYNRFFWKDATQTRYTEYELKGEHLDLLFPGFVEDNAKVIQGIVKEIVERTEQL
ncbi:amino acid adenylation domain-containing protein [Paenibacillus elgii]